MQIKTINLGRGAFGQPGVPFLLSRRAHLLTTPKGRWYALRHRALCEADAASAEALWTMPQLCGAAVIVHAVIASTPALASVRRGTDCTPLCANCPHKPATGSFVCGYDYQPN